MPLPEFITTMDISTIWRDCGYAQLRAGYFQKALIYFNWVLEVKPKDLEALMGRGVAHQQLGHYPHAMSDFNTVLRCKPRYARALTARGETNRLMGFYTEAIADFNLVLKTNPDNVCALVGRGALERQLGLYKGALTDLSRALKLYPFYTPALVERGETKRLMGQEQEALDDFLTALKLNPQQASALAGRGRIKLQRGLYLEALDDFEAALKILPAYPYALAGQGEIMLALGFYQEAFTSFETALKGDPHNASLSTWLAHAKLLQQQTARINHKAVQEHPDGERDVFSLLELDELEQPTSKSKCVGQEGTALAAAPASLRGEESAINDLNAAEPSAGRALDTINQPDNHNFWPSEDPLRAAVIKRKIEPTERALASAEGKQEAIESQAYKKQMSTFFKFGVPLLFPYSCAEANQSRRTGRLQESKG